MALSMDQSPVRTGRGPQSSSQGGFLFWQLPLLTLPAPIPTNTLARAGTPLPCVCPPSDSGTTMAR